MARWGRRSTRKYGNIPTERDGYRFDSLKEARRYDDLKLLAYDGAISHLIADKSQLRYPCVVNGLLICTYIADFRYIEEPYGTVIVEDTKGKRTREYLLKRKLVMALYGIEILEV